MEVERFEDLQDELMTRVRKITWCSAATLDTQDRTRIRLLHPIWEGPVAWVLTNRDSLKAKHLERNPHVSLCYWDPDHRQVYADCRAQWCDTLVEKARVWQLFKSEPEPYGYDPAIIWSGPDDPTLGLLRLDPWRLELSSIHDLEDGKMRIRVWRPAAESSA